MTITHKHDALMSEWQHGQRWETMVTRNIPEDQQKWVPVGNNGYAEPVWEVTQEYRRAPNDKR